MVYRKRSISLLTGALSILALGGCLTGNNPSPGDFSVSTDIKVLSIQAPQGAQPGTVTTRTIDSRCEDGQSISDTTVDSTYYQIYDGRLHLWTEGDCLMSTFTGSSSTIVGTWRGNSVDATDSLPVSLRPSGCYEGLSEEPLFDNVSVEYKITEDNIHAKLSGTVCFARSFTESIKKQDIPGYEIVADGCSTVKIRNVAANRTAIITSDYRNDSATVQFSYKGTVCTGRVYLGLSQETPNCSDSTNGFEGFDACEVASGFYDSDTSLAKQAVFTQALKKSLGWEPRPFSSP